MIGVLKEDIEETPLRNCGKEKQELQEISKSLEESQKKLPHKQMKETVQYLKMDIEAMKKTQIERILLEMKKIWLREWELQMLTSKTEYKTWQVEY